MNQIKHNPGVFKQPNKTHKTGRHRSKGEILKSNKGQVSVKVMSRIKKSGPSKDQRKNRLIQIRKYKRDEIINKKRRIGNLNGSPHIVVDITIYNLISI
jgi:pre-rRNA-processing protein TSR1